MTNNSQYKLACPHCRQRIRIRSSNGLNELLRTTYLQCTNEGCGWTGIGSFEITHELSPSAITNPKIDLPVAPYAERLRALQTRNDDDQLTMFAQLDEGVSEVQHG